MMNLTISRDLLDAFCQRHPIKKLALFGSVLRPDFRPGSDVDVLVEFLPGSGVDLFDMVEMAQELSVIFGREVDLRTPAELSRYFRDEVLAGAEILYEQR